MKKIIYSYVKSNKSRHIVDYLKSKGDCQPVFLMVCQEWKIGWMIIISMQINRFNHGQK